MSCDGSSTPAIGRSIWRHAGLRVLVVAVIIAAPLAAALHSHPSDAAPEPRGNTLAVWSLVADGVRLPGATVVLHGRRGGDSVEFDIEQRLPLEPGGVAFRGVTPGDKRVQFLDASGRTLVLHKMRVDGSDSDTTADIRLAPVRLCGRVVTDGVPAPDAKVEFADPEHPAIVLASTQADAAGRYETMIWQRGEIVGYSFEEKPGDRMTGPVLRTRTCADGEFRFTSDADADTPSYVIARGHALVATALRASNDNVIQLEPLAAEGTVAVMSAHEADDAQPLHARRLRVAPAGRAIHHHVQLRREQQSVVEDHRHRHGQRHV